MLSINTRGKTGPTFIKKTDSRHKASMTLLIFFWKGEGVEGAGGRYLQMNVHIKCPTVNCMETTGVWADLVQNRLQRVSIY